MNDISERKFEIVNRLEKEVSNLNLLKERAQRSNQLTKGMVGILDSFEHRLARLESTILPVYNETGNLQRRQENIERTLGALDQVVGYYAVSQQVDKVVRAGPTADLDAFLKVMARLRAALTYFEKNNPASVERENVATLYNSGGDALNREFKEILLKHSQPVSPALVLDVEDVQPPVRFPPELTRIADWLVTNNRDEYMNVYARVRATVLLKSLQHLKDQQKSSSGGSTSTGSPMLRVKLSGRSKAPLRRWDVLDQQETENYLETVVLLQKLMPVERALMHGIVPQPHHHQVFQIVVKEALDLVVQDGENISSRAKRCISRGDFAAVLIVFPVLHQLQCLQPDFERSVEGCDLAVRSQFANILSALHATGAKVLDELMESVRNDVATQLPRDGTVHQLTSNVMVFLEQLLEYADTISRVLSPTSRDQAPLGTYTKQVLAQLSLTLANKSEAFSDVYLRAIFRLNNDNYVLKALQRSGLLNLVALSAPNCQDTYHNVMLDRKKAYSLCWSKVLSHIWSQEDNTPISLLYLGKLRDKDRNVIKERFAGFNKEMDELCRVQRGYCIPDVELRESLKRDNKEFLLPKYNAFYDKYAAVPFTKNPDKYVKYTPTQVAELIDRFFDVAA